MLNEEASYWGLNRLLQGLGMSMWIITVQWSGGVITRIPYIVLLECFPYSFWWCARFLNLLNIGWIVFGQSFNLAVWLLATTSKWRWASSFEWQVLLEVWRSVRASKWGRRVGSVSISNPHMKATYWRSLATHSESGLDLERSSKLWGWTGQAVIGDSLQVHHCYGMWEFVEYVRS